MLNVRARSPGSGGLLVVVLALTALLTLACASPIDGSGAAGGPPAPGGTLRVALASDPACLDPQQTSQLPAMEVARSLVDTLTDQDTRTGRIVPWLASAFTVADGARRFDFTLRPGVTFSDGTPLDATAVKATFDRLRTLPATGAPSYLRGYTGTTVVDPLHLSVTFATPNAQFLQATSGAGFGILSPATAARPLGERCRGGYVGSGPFVLDHYTSNQEVVLRKRADYAWPSSRATHPGPAWVDRVEMLFVAEPGARSGALDSGQIHVAEDVQPIDQSTFTGNGFRLLSMSAPGLVPPLSLNHAGILADQRVRQALQTAVDRREIVETVLSPLARPATAPLSSTTPFVTPMPDRLVYDPAASARLLDEAGWVPGPDGIRVRGGQRLALRWLVPAPMPPADEVVQAQLRRVGVDVRLDAVAPARYVEQQQAGAFDMTAVSVVRADPDVLRSVFSSRGANLWHLPPSPLDDALDRQASATDDAARSAAVADAQTWILDHADTVPLYESAIVHGVADSAHDVTLDASARLDLHDVWVG